MRKEWLDGQPFDMKNIAGIASTLKELDSSSGALTPNTCGVISYDKVNGIHNLKYQSCTEKRKYLCQSTCLRQCQEFKLPGNNGEITVETNPQQILVAGTELK